MKQRFSFSPLFSLGGGRRGSIEKMEMSSFRSLPSFSSFYSRFSSFFSSSSPSLCSSHKPEVTTSHSLPHLFLFDEDKLLVQCCFLSSSYFPQTVGRSINRASHVPIKTHRLTPSFPPHHSSLALNITLQRKGFSSNSFIRSVMSQVEKELQSKPELEEAFNDLRKSAQQKQLYSHELINKAAHTISSVKEASITAYIHTIKLIEGVKSRAGSIVDGNTYLNNVMKMVEIYWRSLSAVLTMIYDKGKDLIGIFSDDGKRGEAKAAKWRQEQAVKRHERDQKSTATEKASAECFEANEESKTEYSDSKPMERSLVVAKASIWERFGTKLKDMPFLNAFYENPLFGSLFGETEIAASIREMRTHDSSFRLPELIEIVEQVVAPHMVDRFLLGDSVSLRLHCGDAAFAALESSIKERDIMKVKLDPSVLLLRGVDLTGAKTMEDGLPWFVFTFTTQQINCLRDQLGNIVDGKVDDIREVVYSMALTRHTHLDAVGLQHPWMIKEFAILRNTPSW